MLEAALVSAQRVGTWELFADALDFAQGRIEVRGLSNADAGAISTALLDAVGLHLTEAEQSRLQQLLGRRAAAPPSMLPDTAHPNVASDAYMQRLLDGDRAGAVALTRAWVTEGMSGSEILLDVLGPAQHEVGRLWAAGVISIVQEQFCTAVTQFVMTDLYPGIVNTDPRHRRLVAIHARGSAHHLGLRMVADVLECEGWSTTYLIDDLPIDELIALIVDEHADLLLISASMPGQVPDLGELIAALRRDVRTRGVKVVVGGRPFVVAPQLVDAVGADGWAPDARSAIRVCDKLIGADHDL